MGDAGLQKIESINRRLAPALIFAAVSAWFFQSFIMGSDLFWHLAAGRDIWQRGSVPHSDPFSHTFGGREWLNHEWLWDIIYWRFYEIGPDAVAWFNIGVLVVIFSLGYLLAYQTTGSIFASGVAVWLAAITSHWFLDIRPHLVTLLITSIVLVTRHHKWACWTWPPLMILWTNLHAGFVFGIGLVGLMMLVRTFEQSRDARKLSIPWTLWIAVGLCLFAWLVNPFGWRLIAYPLEYLKGDTIYKQLIEWHPPPFGLDPTYFQGSFWWFVILAFIGLFCGGKRHLYLIALSAVTFAMAWKSRRFIPLFVVTATPLVSLTILAIRANFAERYPKLKTAWAGVGASLVALLVATYMWSHVKLGPSLLRHWAMGDLYPEEAVEYLKAIGPDNGPPKRILNYYNWGGYIMLHAPGAKVFIDGRANTLYDEAIYKDYQLFLAGRPTPERLARYPADVSLLPAGGFSGALENFPSPWKPIYRNPRAVILAPPGSPLLSADLPAPSEVLKSGIQPMVRRALAEANRGDTQQAIETLNKALEDKPYETRVYGLLAQLYAKMGSFDQLSALIERGIQENPRQHIRLRSMEGSTLQRAGQLQRALVAYKLAISKGPFSNSERQLRRIKELERELARQERGY